MADLEIAAMEKLKMEDEYNARHHGRRVEKLAAILAMHPDVKLVRCADENTGVRFGQSKCRVGCCAKIGRTTYQYQLWAVWAN